MKAVIIKGIELPDPRGFLDVRIYGDGFVLIPCAIGECGTVKAEEIEVEDE